jgi:hypothetical protein
MRLRRPGRGGFLQLRRSCCAAILIAASQQISGDHSGAKDAMDSELVTPNTEGAVAADRNQTALYSAGFNRMVATGHGVIGGFQDVTAEMLAFWQSRVKEGMATGQRLFECDSLEGVLEIQLDYTKAALQSYIDQFAKIGSLAARSLAHAPDIATPSTPEAPAPAA